MRATWPTPWLFVFALFGLLRCGGSDDAIPSLSIGGKTPDFALQALDGTMVESRLWEGKVVVLNFWATWCQPCLVEIPELKALAATKRVEVVAVALDEEGERAVQPFVERHGIDYTVLLGNQEVFTRLGGFTIPYTLLLDQARQVVEVYRGPTTRDQIERDMEAIRSKV